MAEVTQSVTVDTDLCKGCTNCLKRCPTEAIRVRRGKAQIIPGRCIDCGECIRVCPHHAKKVVSSGMDVLDGYKYTIALPAPSFYGQFADLDNANTLLRALLTMGFDDVYEVAAAAELVSEATKRYIAEKRHKLPLISSACPTITRLIQIRFPDLIDNIIPIVAPVELAALMARKQAVERTGLKPEEIGCIFITPCPAKVTSIMNPIGFERSNIDAAIAINEIWPILRPLVKPDWRADGLSRTGSVGISWGGTGGEATGAMEERYLAADGIENCLRVLEALENDVIAADFIELNACPGGCVGGVLTVENPFIALVRLKKLRKGLNEINNRLPEGEMPPHYKWDSTVDYHPVMELDDDIFTAIEKMSDIDKLVVTLRGLDCGSCGSPTCRAFSEDVIQGHCPVSDCPFILRDSLSHIANELVESGLNDFAIFTDTSVLGTQRNTGGTSNDSGASS